MNLNEKKESKSTKIKNKQSETFEEFKNVIYFDCDEKEHYVIECLNFKKLKKMKSLSITTQVVLSLRKK